MTLSNLSHLVYITLFGETDGVTLSRLGCIWCACDAQHYSNPQQSSGGLAVIYGIFFTFRLDVTTIGENQQLVQMNRLSLRNNWLKFKIVGKSPITLEEFIDILNSIKEN